MEFVKWVADSLAFVNLCITVAVGGLPHLTWSPLFPVYSNRLIYHLGILFPSTIGEAAKRCGLLALSCMWKRVDTRQVSLFFLLSSIYLISSVLFQGCPESCPLGSPGPQRYTHPWINAMTMVLWKSGGWTLLFCHASFAYGILFILFIWQSLKV